MRAFAARRELFAATLTTAEVSALLGVSAGTLRAPVRAGALLAIRDERRRLRFPAWQFDAEDPSAVIAGLPRVLVILRSQRLSEVGLARWFLTPKSLLLGRTPIEALQNGDVDDVLSEANALRAS
jgi:excisionase family DNA binding protein